MLTQTALSTFATLVSTTDHPRNFKVRLKYRTLAPGNPRSVGLSFDYVNGKQSQDVYTAINPNGNTPSVQLLSRLNVERQVLLQPGKGADCAPKGNTE